MAKRPDDGLDREAMRSFAWRLPSAAMAADEAREDTEATTEDAEAGEAVAEDSPEAEARRAKLRAQGEALEAAILRAWSLGYGEAQLRATRQIIRDADELSLFVVVLRADRNAPVRYGRLLVRYFEQLDPKERRTASFLLGWLPIDDCPELPQLFCDVVEHRCRALLFPITLRMDDYPLRDTTALARLTQLLESDDLTVVELAACFLQYASWEPAIPALRRALRLPSMAVRVRAAYVLWERFATRRVEVEDLLFLLDDALVHPLPEDCDELAYHYEAALEEMLIELRPDAAEPVLLRLANDETEDRGHYRSHLDSSFALRILVQAYPRLGMRVLDSWCRQNTRRISAGYILKHLPAAEAVPRLQVFAAAPHPYDHKAATETLLKTFDTVFDASPERVLPLGVLDGPLSADAAPRLLVIRGEDDEAASYMLATLLAEAPKREALALSAYALLREHFKSETLTELGLPAHGLFDYARERFGPTWDAAVLELAERIPWAFQSELGSVARRIGELDPPLAQRLRTLIFNAVRRVEPDIAGGAWSAVSNLSTLPATPDEVDLLEPLWRVVIQAPERGDSLADRSAWEVLERFPPLPELDRRIAELVRSTLAQLRDEQQLAYPVRRQLRYRLAAAVKCALTRNLDGVFAELLPQLRAGVPLAVDACRFCLSAVVSRFLGEEWRNQVLAQPAHPYFEQILGIVHRESEERERFAAQLEALLPEAPPHAAQVIVDRLLALGRIDAADPRLAELLLIPSLPWARLLWQLLYLDKDFIEQRPELAELVAKQLCEGDDELIGELVESLYSSEQFARPYLQGVSKRTHSKFVKRVIERRRRPDSRDGYWQDPPEQRGGGDPEDEDDFDFELDALDDLDDEPSRLD